MIRSSRSPYRLALLAALAAMVVTMVGASTADAASRILWGNFGNGQVRSGPLPPGTATTLFSESVSLYGMTIDRAGGQVYVANQSNGRISRGPLSGGAPTVVYSGEGGPRGMAIDADTGTLYWATSSGHIRKGPLGGGTATSLYTGQSNSTAVAIDVPAGKIYWADCGADIKTAPLAGGGPVTTLYTGTDGLGCPNSLYLDRTSNTLYWSNESRGTIQRGSAAGGTATTLYTGLSIPGGVQVDPATNTVYWGEWSASQVRSGPSDGSGPITTLYSGENRAFATALLAFPPTVTTEAASDVRPVSATLNATVNPSGRATTYHFEYGTTTAYGQRTPDADGGSGNTAEPRAAGISGLQPQTTYHFRVVATNADGTSEGADQVFTTSALAPDATTGAATGVGQTGATLNGEVKPNGVATTYHFEYGKTPAYGERTADVSAGAGTAAQAASADVSGLAPATEYHYRIVATSAAGTTTGGDGTFTTAAPPLPPPAAAPATLETAPSLAGTGRLVLSHRNTRANEAGTDIGARCVGPEGATCVASLKLEATRYRSRNEVGAATASDVVKLNLAAGQAKNVRVQLPAATRKQFETRRKAVVRAVAALGVQGISVKKLMTVYDASARASTQRSGRAAG